MASKDQLNERIGHSTVSVGDSLYVWAGGQYGFPEVHDSEEKKRITSSIQNFTPSTGQWITRGTTGTPPLGVKGYCCTAINDQLYYFGGWCGHDDCYHNSITQLDTVGLQWRELEPTDATRPVMRRGSGGMIPFEHDGVHHLLMIGGYGSKPAVQLPHNKYINLPNGAWRTNEHLMYNLSSRKWNNPLIIGQCIPAASLFIIEKIDNTRAVLFGGRATDDGAKNTYTNNIYMLDISIGTVFWQCIKKPEVIDQWPDGRYFHAGAIITGSDCPMLVISGGKDRNIDTLDDCWIFNITQHFWIKLDVPHSVSNRWGHSLSVFVMSPHCVWIITAGGADSDGRVVTNHGRFDGFVTNPNIVMLTELVTNSKGEWIVSDTLDTNGMNNEEYKKKYQQQLQLLRRIWLEEYQKPDTANIEQTIQALIKSLEEKEKEKEREAQVYHQQLEQKEKEKAEKEQEIKKNYYQLQEKDRELHQSQEALRRYQQQALTGDHRVTSKDEMPEWKNIADENEQLKANITMLTEEKLQLENKNDISTEKIEKLEAKVVDGDTVIAKLTKEKLQLNEELQSMKDTTVTIAEEAGKLKAKVDDDIVIAKLTKEKLQLKEELQSMKDTLTAEDNEKREPVKDIGIQFDYIFPSMDNLKCLSDVNIASKKLFLIQGDRPGVSGGSLPSTETVEVAVVALVGGQFVFPKNTVLVSAVYAVSVSKPLLKALRLEMQHCVDLSRGIKTKYLKFAIAPISTPNLPYQFSIVDEGEFSEGKWYGSITREKFCLVGVVGSLTNGEERGDLQEHRGHQIGGGDHELEARQQQGAGNMEQEGEGGNDDQNGGDHQQEEGEQGQQQGAENVEEEEEEENESGNQQHVESEQQPRQEEMINTEATGHQSRNVSEQDLTTDISKSMAYCCIMYYEVKEVHDLITFTATKRLNALIEYFKKNHANAEIRLNIYYQFGDSSDYIELILDHTPQKHPFTGWTIQSRVEPCRLYKEAIDQFGALDTECPIPPNCTISVYGSPSSTTVPMLYYAVPLKGVLRPVTLYIDVSLRNIPSRSTPLPLPVDTSDTTSSRPTEATTSNAETGTVDLDIVKGKVETVLMNNQVALKKVFSLSLQSIADQLLQIGIISQDIHRSPSYDDIIGSFLAGLIFIDSQSVFKEHCNKFLSALSQVGGPVTFAVSMLRKEWGMHSN